MSANKCVDLRSDTVTKPSADMRRAMVEAEVGDDVLGDDPTVIKLQERVAEMMGKEAALFVPSGSMANQTSIRAHTQPGDEIIAHEGSHIYHYEGGAPSAISGCSLCLLPGARGLFSAEQVTGAIRPQDSHFAQSRLVIVENTHNRGGGTVWPLTTVEKVARAARAGGLLLHLDGARLMNACVATGHKPAEFAKHFDSISTCFSKGLGAPVGSAVAGSTEFIRRVHRYRKMFGGGMRQSGILAAAALYALDHHIERLADDHENAKLLAGALAEMPHVTIDVAGVETNIVYFDIDEDFASGRQFCDKLEAEEIRMLPIGPQRVRAVTHLDVSRDGVERAVARIDQYCRSKG